MTPGRSNQRLMTETDARYTDVDKKILRWLLRYPLQRVEDITLVLQVSQNTIYRHLTKLVAEQVVEYITPPLTIKASCRFYYLNNTGLHKASFYEQADVRALARSWGADERGILRLLPRLSSLVVLQDLINALIIHAPALFAHSKGYHARLTWHWQRDYQHRFLSQGRLYTCSADAALLFRRTARPDLSSPVANNYSALLFYDSGVLSGYNHQLISLKLEAVLRYRDSLKLRLPVSPFPAILVLVPDERLCSLWQQKASALATSLQTEPLVGAIAALPRNGTIRAVAGLPWQKLSSPTSCRLRDLFVALPPDALLPGLEEKRSINDASSAVSEGKLIQGKFSQRLKTLSLTPGEDSEQERIHIALLRLCLSERHIELLETLYVYPLLTTKELAILQGIQADSTTRYLYELRRYSCLEQWHTAYGDRWHLSARGLHLIAVCHHVSLPSLVETKKQEASEGKDVPVQRGLPLLKKRLKHTVGLYTFFIRLYLDADIREGDHQQLQWWETGARCSQRFRDHGTWQVLRPDAMFLYRTDERQLLSWLEWYEGSSSSKQLLGAKLDIYAQYARTQAWKPAHLPALPVLHIVIIDENHIQPITQMLTDHLANCGLLVRLTTATHIEKQGPLAAIWTQILPIPATPVSRRGPARRSLLDISQI